MFTRVTLLAPLALALIACGPAPPKGPLPAAPSAQAQIPPWGLDLSARDPKVRPGDDFYRYADGHWLDTHKIPADRTRWGSFDELDERASAQVLEVVHALPLDAPEGSNAQKVGDYYRAFVDIAAIDAKGIVPARAGIDAISRARNHHELTRLMGRSDLALLAPLRLSITPDQKDPDRYAVIIAQSGLGLPDRDYYLKPDAVYATMREKYRAHIARMLTLIGEPNPAEEAQGILEVETHIAQLQWPAAKRRERDLTYNPRTRTELERMVPGFYWETLLATAGVDAQPQFIVRELDAVQGLGKLFLDVPVDTWRPYFKYHYLVSNAAVLPQALDDEVFDFYGRTLNGQQAQRPRDKRAVRALDADLGEAVGALYVERFFPPSSKAQVQQLVEYLRASYAARIQALPWMTPATKKAALEKLAAFHPKLGYPDKWRDYTALSIVRGDAFGNSARAGMFEWQRQVKRLGGPTDRGEWGMTPQTINAYYNPTFNEVVFPAAILQPPFFDPHADAAVNYGGIGAVIGHEMGHGFDDQGVQVRCARGAAHLVGAGRHRGLCRAHRRARHAVRRLPRAAGTERQRPPHARGEHRRPGRSLGGLRGLSPLPQWSCAPGARRPQWRSALLPGLRPGLVRARHRRAHPPPGALRSAQPGALSRQRRGAQRGCLVRRLRRHADRQAVPRAGRARAHLVS